jgi:hypothetical protein
VPLIDDVGVLEVIVTLRRIALDRTVKVPYRIQAAQAYLDRTLGKPPTALNPVEVAQVDAAKHRAEAQEFFRLFPTGLAFRRTD